jgi:hypothetical protein
MFFASVLVVRLRSTPEHRSSVAATNEEEEEDDDDEDDDRRLFRHLDLFAFSPLSPCSVSLCDCSPSLEEAVVVVVVE